MTNYFVVLNDIFHKTLYLLQLNLNSFAFVVLFYCRPYKTVKLHNIILTYSITRDLIKSIVYKQQAKFTSKFMMHFICTFLTNMFRRLLLPSSG